MIETDGRFVEKDQVRVMNNTTCDVHSSLHSTAEVFYGSVQGALVQTDKINHRRDPLTHTGTDITVDDRKEPQVLQYRQIVIKQNLLWDQTYPKLGLGKMIWQSQPKDGHGPTIRPQQARGNIGQSALSSTVRAKKTKYLSGSHLQRDRVHRNQ